MSIPKIIHQVWVGPNKIPESDLAYAETFRRNCPGWHFVLHAEHPSEHVDGPWSEVRPLPDTHLEYLIAEIKSQTVDRPLVGYAAMSDVYRVEALIRDGGVYFDSDVQCLGSIDDTVRGAKLGISEEFSCNNIGNFFLLAEPGHPALFRCLHEYRESMRKYILKRLEFHPVPITGPEPTQRAITSHPDARIYPFEVFSPWNPHYPLPEDLQEVPWPAMTRCVHMFSGKWTKMTVSDDVDVQAGLQVYWKKQRKI